jgi:hypothetical protein
VEVFYGKNAPGAGTEVTQVTPIRKFDGSLSTLNGLYSLNTSIAFSSQVSLLNPVLSSQFIQLTAYFGCPHLPQNPFLSSLDVFVKPQDGTAY